MLFFLAFSYNTVCFVLFLNDNTEKNQANDVTATRTIVSLLRSHRGHKQYHLVSSCFPHFTCMYQAFGFEPSVLVSLLGLLSTKYIISPLTLSQTGVSNVFQELFLICWLGLFRPKFLQFMDRVWDMSQGYIQLHQW